MATTVTFTEGMFCITVGLLMRTVDVLIPEFFFWNKWGKKTEGTGSLGLTWKTAVETVIMVVLMAD